MTTTTNATASEAASASTVVQSSTPIATSPPPPQAFLMTPSLDPLDNMIHEHYYSYHIYHGKYQDKDEETNRIHKSPTTTTPHHDTHHRALHFVAAGTAAAISCAMYNPLDCLRVRWQLYTPPVPSLPQLSSLPKSLSVSTFGYHILQTEGLWYGLWKPGLTSNVMGMAGSAAIRLGYYETVRDCIIRYTTNQDKDDLFVSSLSSSLDSSSKSTSAMMLSGLLCGSIGYLVTTPFHLLKTTIQANLQHQMNTSMTMSSTTTATATGMTAAYYPQQPQPQPRFISSPLKLQNFSSGAYQIVHENHGNILSLWKGAIPLTCRGALFTCGQMVGYDGCKTLIQHIRQGKNNNFEKQEETPLIHILASITASFGASFLSAPADYVMAKYMASSVVSTSSSSSSSLAKKPQVSLSSCIYEIYKTQGIQGFWRGWSIFFIRLTPVMITSSTLYEQMRNQFGLGYMS